MSIGGLQPGDVIGRDFRVVEPLAAGAMGAVYVVEQLSTGKQRALKLMAADIADNSRARERFILEARVGSRIDSDHVVEVVTAGFDDETGTPYLVMELLRGESLGELSERRGTLPVAHVREILKQAGHALEQAHKQGIVHRDIKPDNVFVAESRRQGVPFTVKILDFGIAKLVAERTNEGTQPVGTPLFMSPEQTDRQGEIGPPTDVWPLGLIAFLLLTGDIFWRGGSSSLSTLLREVVIDPISPASERAAELGMLDRLPEGFDAWFARCVARDPKSRYQDAGEAVRAFDLLAHEPDRAGTVVVLPTGAVAQGAQTNELSTHPTLAIDAEASNALARATGMTAASTNPAEASGNRGGVLIGGAVLVAALGIGGYFASGASSSATGADVATAAKSASVPASAAPTASSSAVAKPASCPAGMIAIAGGNMYMGSTDKDLNDDVRPPHKVMVKRYCMDKFEVTAGDYERCVKAGNCLRAPAEVSFAGATPALIKQFSTLCNLGVAERAKHPVNCVDWTMAKNYCSGEGGRLPKGGARLPSEAEWEFAARGSGQRTYPWGDDAPASVHLNACGTECVAWLAKAGIVSRKTMFPADDGYAGTAPVGSFPKGASSAGLMDLAGNVWEWTADWYGAYPSDGTRTAPSSGEARVVRGGAFNGTDPAWAKPAYRWKTAPASRSHGIGFRCAASLPAAGQ